MNRAQTRGVADRPSEGARAHADTSQRHVTHTTEARGRRRRNCYSAVLGPLVLAAAMGVAGTAAGSTVSNGPSTAAVLTARRYVDNARGVRIQGTVRQVTDKYAVDVSLFANGDSSGTVTVNGHRARVVIVGNWYYLKGTAGFWTTVFSQPVSNSERLSKEWIGVPRSSITGLGANLSMEHLRGGFDLPPNVGLTSLGTSDVDGQRALGVRISGKGTLWIATLGGRPVAFDGTNDGNVLAIRFSGWGLGAPPLVPPGAVQFPDSGTSTTLTLPITASSASPDARSYVLAVSGLAS